MIKDWRSHHNTALFAKLAEAGLLPPDWRGSLENPGITMADPERSRLPLGTKTAALLSTAFYHGIQEEADPDSAVAVRIKRACAAWDAEAEHDAIVQFINDQTEKVIKKAHAADRPSTALYAYAHDGIEAYPMGSDADVIKSAEGLVADLVAGCITPGIAREAAVQLVKRAQHLGVEAYIPRRVLSIGADRQPDWGSAAAVASLRVNAGMPAGDVDFCVKLAEAGRDGTIKVSEAMDDWAELDRANGVSYAAHPTPHEALFRGESCEVLNKLASAHVLLANVPVPAGIFAGCPEDRLRPHLRQEDMVKMAELQKAASKDALACSTKIHTEVPRPQQFRLLTALHAALQG